VPDNGGQIWDLRLVWLGEPRAEVIEPPDQSTYPGLGLALITGQGIELVNEPLGMNPAQGLAGLH
jgi:hypothetical protein